MFTTGDSANNSNANFTEEEINRALAGEKYYKGASWHQENGSSDDRPIISIEEVLRNKKLPQNVTTCKILVTRLSDIQPEAISWLWQGRIALGKLTLISGEPGVGKSLLTTTLAAVVSKGYEWPIDGTHSPTGGVLLLSAEDDPADTIRQRVDAAGGDCDCIHIVRAVQEPDRKGLETQRLFSLKRDVLVLERLISSLPDCKLVVIDPISAYLDGIDSHNNSEVRGVLAPLADLAARHKVAVILVHHLNKGSGASALHRNMGSIAFPAAVRSAFVVTKDRENPERRLLLSVKTNIAKEPPGLAYSINTADNKAPIIFWDSETITMTADEALAPPEIDGDRTGTDEAVELLFTLLSNGPVEASEVKKRANEAGISPKSLRKARERLRVKTRHSSSFVGGWELSLPTQDAQVAPSHNGGTLEVGGHLGSAEANTDAL